MTEDTETDNSHVLYKILSSAMWGKACGKGFFEGSADDKRDGFSHLSTAPQLQGTLNKYFRGQPDLLLIAFEKNSLAQALRWEPSRGGDLFPHYYGLLPTKLALWQRPLLLGADGVPEYEKGRP